MYNSTMAEIHARRRLRLRQLIEEQFEGNQLRMARAVDLSRSHIRRALAGGVNLGEHAASRIEQMLGLPHGWMDLKPAPGTVPTTPYKARMGQPPKVRSVNDLLNAGYTQREIARQFGVHYSTVSRAVQRERAAEKEHKSTRPQRVAA